MILTICTNYHFLRSNLRVQQSMSSQHLLRNRYQITNITLNILLINNFCIRYCVPKIYKQKVLVTATASITVSEHCRMFASKKRIQTLELGVGNSKFNANRVIHI